MPTMPEPILEINDFCVDFKTENGHHRVVDHLSFQLQRGKTLGIVGESGSGKSVTALSIMRLLKTPLYSGHIYFKENKGKATDLLQLSNTALRSFRGKRIGMIFQEPMTSLNPSMRCGTQISEVMQLHLNLSKQQAKQRSMQLLEDLLKIKGIK
jgi:ABC-type microcin C transport system duplicated ATPase subunit YejF